jgi:hypothetical protein
MFGHLHHIVHPVVLDEIKSAPNLTTIDEKANLIGLHQTITNTILQYNHTILAIHTVNVCKMKNNKTVQDLDQASTGHILYLGLGLGRIPALQGLISRQN